jgi:23S rRNA (uracil1939-C5)-methyltransferase/tRNA (uracil-5-)-methyltransferase
MGSRFTPANERRACLGEKAIRALPGCLFWTWAAERLGYAIRVKNRNTFREDPFPRGTEIEIEISTLTNMGQGLGRVALPVSDDSVAIGEVGHNGWVVLVPFALPGERVRVRIWRNQKNFSDGDLVEILRPSEHRVDPICPLFGQCGGCQYQNLEYQEQLAWKRRQVAELLGHMAGVDFPVNDVISSPKTFGYRSKITPHFEKPRPDRPVEIGFLRAGSRRAIVDVERCLLATEAINGRLKTERESIRARAAVFKKGATLLLREANEGVVTDPSAIIHENVDGLRLHFPAGEFFQNNPFILDAFVRHVREQAAAGGARFLVDAYCGSGLFCLSAARSFEHATGIEISEPSIRWARENALENGLENCSFATGDASAIFAQVDYAGADTAVVIDPPRRGSDEVFLNQLVAFGARTIVYVSCNPATQMRDLKLLLKAGYELRDVQPFDLFPQTKHLECVITLTRET